MIASVDFRNFKALRNTRVALAPFNVLIGPNGSGKTSLIQALLRLRTLSRLAGPAAPTLRPPGPDAAADTPAGAPDAPTSEPTASSGGDARPRIFFRFFPPHQDTAVLLSCVSELVCDTVQVMGARPEAWPPLQAEVARIQAYLFDHYAMAAPARADAGRELSSNGGNLAAVLADLAQHHPAEFAALQAEFCRLLPEYTALVIGPVLPAGAASTAQAGDPGGRVRLAARLREEPDPVEAENLSQGTLYLLAILALAFTPRPPSVVCLEEVDRGIHPRMLRDVRDVLYRLSHPASFGLTRAPVQVLVTTHSPYLLDLFRDHPEEIVIAQKQGNAATFERLGERADLAEVIREGPLGDLWFAGVLGGVPDETPRA